MATAEVKPNEHGVFEDSSNTVEIPISKSYKTKLRIHTVECEDGWRYSYDFSSELGRYGGAGGMASEREPSSATEFEAIKKGFGQAIRWLESHAKSQTNKAVNTKVAKVIELVRTWLTDQRRRPKHRSAAEEPQGEQSKVETIEVHGMPAKCSAVVMLGEIPPEDFEYGLRVVIGDWIYDVEVGASRNDCPAPPPMDRTESFRTALFEAKEAISDHLATLKPKSAKAKLAQRVWDRLAETLVSHELLTPKAWETEPVAAAFESPATVEDEDFEAEGEFETVEAPIRPEAKCRLRLRVYRGKDAFGNESCWADTAFRGQWSSKTVKESWEWGFGEFSSAEGDDRREATFTAINDAVDDLQAYLASPHHKHAGDRRQLQLAVEDLERWREHFRGSGGKPAEPHPTPPDVPAAEVAPSPPPPAVEVKPQAPQLDAKADFERRLLDAQIAVGRAAQAADEAKERWDAARKACGLKDAEKAMEKARSQLKKLNETGPEYMPLIDGKRSDG